MEIKEVFEPVLNFIKSLQKKDKEPASKKAAKERLKLVLMQDRASVSPDFFEIMKKEIIDVIKKYIEIDEESLEVQLTRGIEAGLEGPALYANIPIKNVKPVAPKVGGINVDDEVVKEEATALSEEQADVVADKILEDIEKSANREIKENANKDEIKVEELRENTNNGEIKVEKLRENTNNGEIIVEKLNENNKDEENGKKVENGAINENQKEDISYNIEEELKGIEENKPSVAEIVAEIKKSQAKKESKTRKEIEQEVMRRREAIKARELEKQKEEEMASLENTENEDEENGRENATIENVETENNNTEKNEVENRAENTETENNKAENETAENAENEDVKQEDSGEETKTTRKRRTTSKTKSTTTKKTTSTKTTRKKKA